MLNYVKKINLCVHMIIKNYVFGILIAVLSIGTAYPQITIGNGATVTISSGTTVTLQQALVNQMGGSLAHSGTINIAGNLTNDGTITANSGSLVNFNGGAMQFVNGASTFALYDADVNQDVTLNNPITINHTLTLNKILNTETQPVYFAISANNPAETPGKYIRGTARMNTRTIGTAALDFLGLEFTMGGDLGDVSLERRSGTTGQITVGGNTGIDMSWKLTASNTGITKSTLKLKFLSEFDNAKNLMAMHLYRGDATYTTWYQVSSMTQDISATNPRVYTYSNYLYQNTKPSLTLSDVANLLPVNFNMISALPKGGNVEVKWAVESAKKGFYIIERGIDGMSFESIGQMASTGDLQYSFMDLNTSNIMASVVYYRVKFVEDAGYNYSAVASLYMEGGQLLLGVYPVPFSDQGINVTLSNPSKDMVTLRLLNQMGIEIAKYEDNSAVVSSVFLGKGLSTGLYFVEVNSSFLNKIVKATKE